MLGCLDELASRYPSTKFVKIISTDCVALVLCQSEPVLHDGKSGDDDSSREAVMTGVRRQFIERVVKDHEDKDNDDDGWLQ
ncbi:hypothetical protein F2Q69_00000576 [Brassica cretica]|uniref:Uncharacterized protein n=1 Tax=Brassica cretica TaxID=69181 RepID=A0A8S9PDW5_BRACR|nr:hypothetical protein F2Q69_00000576 [Brassica cretica]